MILIIEGIIQVGKMNFFASYQLESWYDAMLPGEMQQWNAGNNRATIHYTN
jgi:hypothetical protein